MFANLLKFLAIDLVRQDDQVVDELSLKDSLVRIVQLIVGSVETCTQRIYDNNKSACKSSVMTDENTCPYGIRRKKHNHMVYTGTKRVKTKC
jgi:hypothetical protein